MRFPQLIVGFLLAATAQAEPPVDFTREIVPLFAEHCVRCHSTEQRKGKFSLSTAAEFFAERPGKEPAVVRGQAEAGLLVGLISAHGDEAPEMPEEGTPLTAPQVAMVRRWIAEGAPWPEGATIVPKAKAGKDWWSLQPLRLTLGAVALMAPSAAIDEFLTAELAKQKLTFNPPAPAREFIRRATYDLTGLPPTPEEVEAYAAEAAADEEVAVRRLVDRLLASPRYGEQWGRHWLDVVRFGESSGFERNLVRENAWPFRDYVIRSLNEDKPFDRLMVEHLAGDVLAPEDPAVAIGSAYLVAGPYDDVGNQDAKAAAQIRANTLDEMVATTGSAFLGLTIGCARCHDHKFDPIPQADYYRLQAALAGVRQGSSTWATPAEKAAVQEVLAPLVREQKAVQQELAALQAQAAHALAEHRAELEARLVRPALQLEGNDDVISPPQPARWVRLTVDRLNMPPRPLAMETCEVWAGEGSAARNVALLSAGATITAQGTRQIAGQPGFYAPEGLLDGRPETLWIALPSAQRPQFTIQLPAAVPVSRVRWVQDHARARSLGGAAELYTLELSLDGETWTRVADETDRQQPDAAKREALLTRAALGPAQSAQLAAVQARLAQLQKDITAAGQLPTAWVGTRAQPAQATYLMQGGDPQRHGPEMAPASLAVLAGTAPYFELPLNAPEGERRLALAQWLTAPENPLPLRVLANRVWHYHFGTGLVNTPSDFGYMGGAPSHPALLDFLARRLQAHGWRLKPLHREIMLSRAYRQSSAWQAPAAAVDHDARLLWRFPPRRLTAEEVRDTLLATAGVLDLTRDRGPGFRLYRYLNDNVSTYEPLDTAAPETYRRAVFHQNARAATVDLLSDFDAPDCAFTTPRRAGTTTPLQALTLFNHRFTQEMAAALAARLRTEAGVEAPAQVARAFALGLGRAPRAEEVPAAVLLISQHGLPAFCRALLNANELLYLP